MPQRLPKEVHIVEVGPRDGLQNESAPVATETKLAFIEKLVEAGLTQIEATSFVAPRAIPQLADADEIARRLPRKPGVVFSALVPNERGLRRAIESGIKRIAVFTACSDTFARKNINMTVNESLGVFRPVVREAITYGISVRGYLSTCFVCPYEGEIGKQRVRDLTQQLLEVGVNQVAISDTIGAAVPTNVTETVGHVLKEIPVNMLSLHFHDTYGTALANVYAGLQLGIETFDASAGGLGGCPYAPGAAGNLATEDLIYVLDRMGIETGVDLKKVAEAATLIADALHRELPSKQWKRLGGGVGG